MRTLFLLALAQAPAPDPAAALREIPLTLRVNQAIALGVEHLRRAQLPDGSFAGYEAEHPGGMTAFAAFTLVKSGVQRGDRSLSRALQALDGQVFESTYSAASHLLLLEALHDPARVPVAGKSLEFLLANQKEGVWAYPWGHLCDSNTQFALLGLRAARRMQLDVDSEVWRAALDGLERFRDPSGGFTYAPGDRQPNAGITAAALASLAVLGEVAADDPKLRAAFGRSGEMRADAERWLERRFDPQRNVLQDGAWTPAWQYAYLWALERWCGLTGREHLAERNWYEEGAEWLLAQQGRDGSFGPFGALTDTCFALLFLRRATVTPSAELAEISAELERLRVARPERPLRYRDSALRLTEWWLAGPFAQSGERDGLFDPPFDPLEVRPRERSKVARADWERVTLLSERWTELEKLTERPGNRRLWLLSGWIEVPAPAPGAAHELLLWLELDEGWDVCLDGRRVSRERRRTPQVNSDVQLALELAPGEHLLTIVVEDQRGPTPFGALLTDLAGKAPPAGTRMLGEPRRGR